MNPSPIEPEEAVKRLSDEALVEGLCSFSRMIGYAKSSGERANHDAQVQARKAELSRRLADRASMAERVEKLEAGVKSCQIVFAGYAEMHRQKLGTPSRGISQAERDDIHRKIDRNRDMSDLCLDALLHPKGEQR